MTELNVVFFSGIHVLCLVCTFIQSNPAFLRVTELNVFFSLVLAFLCLVCTFIQSNPAFLRVTELSVVFSLVLPLCVSCVHLYRVTWPFFV